MSRSDSQRILDILERADRISKIVEEGYEKFCQEDKNYSAIERHIEVIGESASQLSESTREYYSEIPWQEIIGMRIRLAHHYFRINEENVWGAATRDVSLLAETLKAKPLDT